MSETKRRKLSKKERQTILESMDGRCAYCGCKLQYENMQIDHVVPLYWHNGPDEPGNMLPACRSCNHYKGSMDLETFREMIERMPRTLMRDSVTYKNAVRYGVVIPNPRHIVFYFETKETDHDQLRALEARLNTQ